MKQFFSLLLQNHLFNGIDENDLHSMLQCLTADLRRFERGETVLATGAPVTHMGIVCTGEVLIAQEDYQGNRTIIAKAGPGDLFGEALACAGADHSPITATAAQPCRILMLQYGKIIRTCANTCIFHSKLIQNMLGILAEKNLQLNEKISVLSKRSTREKILAFLSQEAIAAGNRQFDIPFNRQELADYLCVDRSALSTALGSLRNEGRIAFHRSQFELLDWQRQ